LVALLRVRVLLDLLYDNRKVTLLVFQGFIVEKEARKSKELLDVCLLNLLVLIWINSLHELSVSHSVLLLFIVEVHDKAKEVFGLVLVKIAFLALVIPVKEVFNCADSEGNSLF